MIVWNMTSCRLTDVDDVMIAEMKCNKNIRSDLIYYKEEIDNLIIKLHENVAQSCKI